LGQLRAQRTLGALFLGVSLSVALVSRAPTAHADAPGAQAAQDKAAAREFREGERAYAAGDFRHAAESFENAYAQKPHHAPLWNAARSWDRAGNPVRAANLLEKYLREAPPSARDRDQATQSLADLNKRLARLELRAPELQDLKVDGTPAGETLVYVTPGDHVVTAESKVPPGSSNIVRKTITVRAGELVSVTLTPPGESAKPTQSALVAAKSHGRPTPLPLGVFIGAGALTLISSGLMIASGLDTISRKEEFLATPTQERLDAAFTSQTRTNVLIVSSAVLGAATVVIALLTRFSGTDETTAVAPPPRDASATWFLPQARVSVTKGRARPTSR
jgi:hypothetical protein